MNVTIKKTLVIEFTEIESELLRVLVQNPTSENESVEVSEFRGKLFSILDENRIVSYTLFEKLSKNI